MLTKIRHTRDYMRQLRRVKALNKYKPLKPLPPPKKPDQQNRIADLVRERAIVVFRYSCTKKPQYKERWAVLNRELTLLLVPEKSSNVEKAYLYKKYCLGD